MVRHASESEFVRHEPCPVCGSSDANGLYTDGHSYCFSCGHWESGSDSDPIHKPQRQLMDFSGDIVPLRTRNILEETCRKFNVRIDRDSKTVQFPYYSQSGQLIAYKARDVEKDFRWVGKNEDHLLFGQQL